MIQSTNTAGRLRLLADQIDKEEQPDFVLIIANNDGGGFSSAHKAKDDAFGLIGGMEYRKALILEEETE